MSVQLILYPQNYQGQYSSFGTPVFTQYVSDYSFNIGTLGTGFSGNMLSFSDFLASGLLPAPTNVWQQYNSTGIIGVADAATITNGKVIIDSSNSSPASLSGIYQLISNLTIGATYVLKVQRLAGTTGLSSIGHNAPITISGTTYHPILYQGLPASVGTHTFTFTATHTEQLLIINYANDDNTKLEIGEVSIQESLGSAPTTDIFKDGQVICDLYEESYIPLSLSIDTFQNIHEKKQSFSKPFKLPATKRNNKIFTSLFDLTKNITNDAFSFNPYKKTKCILKEDSFTIFEGYLKLIDILDKEGEISYNVNLYSDTVTLADTLKDKKILDIDMSELLHTYNITNITASAESNDGITLTTNLSTDSFAYNATLGTSKTDVVKYPLCKWNGDLIFDSTDGKVKMQTLEDAFRPWIKCKYLLDRIFDESGFTYSSDFFNSSEFTNLYMDFNWGEGINPAAPGQNKKMTIPINSSGGVLQGYAHPTGTNTEKLRFSTGQIPNIYNTTTRVFTANQNNQNIQGFITLVYCNNASFGTSERSTITAIHKDSSGNTLGSNSETYTIVGTAVYNGFPQPKNFNFNYTLQSGETLQVEVSSTDQLGSHTTKYFSGESYGTGTGNSVTSEFNVVVGSELQVNNLFNIARGDLKQWEFIKGFFDMFNLVALQDKDNPNNLFIEPYSDVFVSANSQYITHKTLTWTDKVDITETTINPLKLKKTVSYNFTKETDDFAKTVYLGAARQEFGSKIIENNDLTALEGEEKIQTIYGSTFIRPLFENFDNDLIAPCIYKINDDGTFTGFKNKPRILFNNGKVNLVSSSDIELPAQAGGSATDVNSFLQFSHLSEIPTTNNTDDYNFETQGLVSTIGSVPVNNLFNTYWSSYYDELYSVDTKIVKYKIYLTPADIANFEFYYKIRIKNKLYRVNKIEYKPYELSSVELILLP